MTHLKKLEEQIITQVATDDSTDRGEKLILHDVIKKLKPKVVVETGTHKGLTTLYMLCALADNKKGHLLTVDPMDWGAQNNFNKFDELKEYVTYKPIKGIEIETKGIDFLFIDGFHEKHEVIAEVKALFPKLSKGAHVYFHDTKECNPLCDVTGALTELNLDVEYLDTKYGMARYINKV